MKTETTKPHCLGACIDPLWCIQRNICKSDAVMPATQTTKSRHRGYALARLWMAHETWWFNHLPLADRLWFYRAH